MEAAHYPVQFFLCVSCVEPSGSGTTQSMNCGGCNWLKDAVQILVLELTLLKILHVLVPQS